MAPTDKFTKAVKEALDIVAYTAIKDYPNQQPIQNEKAEALASIQTAAAELIEGLAGEDEGHDYWCEATVASRRAGDDPPEAFESSCTCAAPGRNAFRAELRRAAQQLREGL